MIVVWLWQADGPASGGRGVSGDRAAAAAAAIGRLRSGDATEAVVEEAETDLGTRTLAGGYYRTGPGWVARTGPDLSVCWVPLERGGPG